MEYDVLVVITAKDFPRLSGLYDRLIEMLECRRLYFVGIKEVGRLLEESGLGDKCSWIDENSILLFDDVHELMTKRLADLLAGRDLPRGVTGWYYQQFLKMQYARICADRYYMVWDGDTIPCRSIKMFQSESGKPYFDMKTELHEGYFETLSKIIPGMRKVIARSFISEHMMIDSGIMKELLSVIESNNDIAGNLFWEKILNAIPQDKIQESYFSEFETYGTFCALRHMDAYALREWHSFRLGGEFFDPSTITDRDFKWLGRDFDAISFEKGHFIRDDHKNLFDNPMYQEKLTARQMLESIQDLFNGGYTEVWEN